MPDISLANVMGRMQNLGFRIYTKQHDMNLVVLRKLPGTVNAFDDTGVAFYKYDGIWQFESWPVTADPGLPSLLKTKRTDGTGIMVHDRQFISAWKLGLHHAGKPDEYPCLDQAGEGVFEVWRDRDNDGRPTYGGPIFRNVTGLQYHHAGEDSVRVDGWSEACVVTKRKRDHDRLMVLTNLQKAAGHGDRFTCTCLGWAA